MEEKPVKILQCEGCFREQPASNLAPVRTPHGLKKVCPHCAKRSR